MILGFALCLNQAHCSIEYFSGMTADVKCALADTEWRWGGAGACFTSQISESPKAPWEYQLSVPIQKHSGWKQRISYTCTSVAGQPGLDLARQCFWTEGISYMFDCWVIKTVGPCVSTTSLDMFSWQQSEALVENQWSLSKSSHPLQETTQLCSKEYRYRKGGDDATTWLICHTGDERNSSNISEHPKSYIYLPPPQ